MADDEEKEKSANQILQALDALSQTLHKARATRRTTSLPLPCSGKYADDVVVDADAEDEAVRPPPRRRLSPMSPLRSKPKLLRKKDDDDDDEEGADDESSALPKSGRQEQEFTAVKPEDVMVEKKGVTSWGATRVVSHIGMRRFGCVFSVEVVSAQGAPPSMNGLRLAVNVRKKEKRDGGGDASDYDEALYVRCSLYGAGTASAGGGAGTNNKPVSFVEPARSPFLLSVAVDGPPEVPELGRRRSTVDLSQFAMEFTEKGQQWDMVFPLATAGGKQAKGGDLFVKLVFQSTDVDGTYGGQLGGEGKTFSSSALSSFARKLRKSSLSNMLTPKMTRTKTPKLDEPEPVAAEVKEKQHEEAEPVVEVKEEPQEEPEPVVEVKEEPHEEEPERELADEPAQAAEVEKEEEQKEPEPDTQNDDSELPVFDVIVDESVEGQQEKAELKEEADEEDKEESDEVAKEAANELEIEALEEATPNDMSDAVADAVEPVEAEAAGSEEVSAVAGDEVASELETEVDKVANDIETEVDTVAESEEALVVTGDEVAKEVANELDTAEGVESATASNVPDGVAKTVAPVEDEAAGPEQVNGESLQVPEQGEDKDASTKPRRRRRFGWRMFALVVTPVAVMVSKNMNVVRF